MIKIHDNLKVYTDTENQLNNYNKTINNFN